MACVLVLDGEPPVLQLLSTALMSDGHQVLKATTEEEGLKLIEQEQPNVVLVTATRSPEKAKAFVKEARHHGYHGGVLALKEKIGVDSPLTDPELILLEVRRLANES